MFLKGLAGKLNYIKDSPIFVGFWFLFVCFSGFCLVLEYFVWLFCLLACLCFAVICGVFCLVVFLLVGWFGCFVGGVLMGGFVCGFLFFFDLFVGLFGFLSTISKHTFSQVK